jgi:hypothetical protein
MTVLEDFLNCKSLIYTKTSKLQELLLVIKYAELTNNEFNKFITALTSGKSNSVLKIIGLYGENDSGKILLDIAKNREINPKQLDKLINCVIAIKDTNFEWVDYLISTGTKFTNKQLQILLAGGYNKDIKSLIATGCKADDLMNNIDCILATKNLDKNLDILEEIVKKNKIIISNNNFETMLSCHTENAIQITTKFIELGFVPNNESIVIFLKSKFMMHNILILDMLVNNDKYQNQLMFEHLELMSNFVADSSFIVIICKFMSLGFVFNISYLDRLLNFSLFSSHTLCKCIYSILKDPHHTRIDINDDFLIHLGQIIDKSYYYYSVSEDDIKDRYATIIYILHTNYKPHKIDYYDLTMRVIDTPIIKMAYSKLLKEFVKYNFFPTQRNLETAYRTANVELVNFCHNYGIMPNYECLYCLCKGPVDQHKTLLYEQLFNMKILPDEKVLIIAIENSSDAIYLIENGAPLTPKVLNALFGTGLIKSDAFTKVDLEKYGMVYDEYVYELCHKYTIYNDTIINKISIDKNILTFRLMCLYDDMQHILAFKNANNMEFDKYCYDNLLVNENSDCFEYVKQCISDEDTNYVVNMASLLRINDTYRAMKVYDAKLLKLTNFVDLNSVSQINTTP